MEPVLLGNQSAFLAVRSRPSSFLPGSTNLLIEGTMPRAMAKRKPSLKSYPHLRAVRASIRGRTEQAIQAAETIAELAEPPLQEVQSAQTLADFLDDAGFTVTRPWADLPTAFRASAGKGRPAVGLLAEYDALPNCGAKPGQWGHGCGHNLLGVGSATAGIAAADVLGKLGKPGRVVVFGCPAEEGLAGKVFMAARGAFAGLDAVLAWHPAAATSADIGGGAAMDSIHFVFNGRTAHAAGSPHEGRSALDAALLMDVAVNYLREHVEENARMHSVITDGGKAPNVVPERAEIYYYVRGRDRKQVDDLRRRVRLCARGAALATETRWRMRVNTSITERLGNRTLGEMMEAILRRCGPPKFTPADARAAGRVTRGKKYADGLDPLHTDQGRGSSDEDNVSWFAPLAKINVACVPKGTVGHNREWAAMVRTPGAHRGMLKAAEALAMGTLELMLNAPLLGKAKAEFRKVRRGKKYSLPISAGPVAS